MGEPGYPGKPSRHAGVEQRGDVMARFDRDWRYYVGEGDGVLGGMVHDDDLPDAGGSP